MLKTEEAIRQALATFCGEDAGRSAAVRVLKPASARCNAFLRGDVSRPVASVIKIALAMAVYDAAVAGKLDLDAPVSRSTFAATRYVSILQAFDGDRELSLREWVALALMTSDNPLAVMLTERVGMSAVNDVLARAGCSAGSGMRAGFREAELGAPNRANQLSARDTLKLLTALEEDAYHEIRHAMSNNLRGTRITVRLPDTAVTAHKTGSLAGVVNDAGIVSDTIGGAEIRFHAVFLTDDQPDGLATSMAIADCTLSIYEAVACVAGSTTQSA